jgi:3-oxoacyl-[acyl-carrier protein] reductase
MSRRHALVLGGTGAIGAAVLRGLARAGVTTTFTFHTNADKANALATEHAQTAVKIDLARTDDVRALMADLRDVDIVVACAAPRETTTDEEIARAFAVTVQAPMIAARALPEDAHAVFVGALHPAQALPLAPGFAAVQGALAPLAMALAKELGPRNVRVNLVTGGLTATGMSSALEATKQDDYKRFSALRRFGTASEIAAPILWLALENTYVSGKVLPANGGI